MPTSPTPGHQEISRLRMTLEMGAHGFVIPSSRTGRLVLWKGSSLRNRDDRRKSDGITGWNFEERR